MHPGNCAFESTLLSAEFGPPSVRSQFLALADAESYEIAGFSGFPLILDVISSFVRVPPFCAIYHEKGFKDEPKIRGTAGRRDRRREPVGGSLGSAAEQWRLVIGCSMRGGHRANSHTGCCLNAAGRTRRVDPGRPCGRCRVASE